MAVLFPLSTLANSLFVHSIDNQYHLLSVQFERRSNARKDGRLTKHMRQWSGNYEVANFTIHPNIIVVVFRLKMAGS